MCSETIAPAFETQNIGSWYSPNTGLSASHISPSVAYSRTQSSSRGIVLSPARAPSTSAFNVVWTRAVTFGSTSSARLEAQLSTRQSAKRQFIG